MPLSHMGKVYRKGKGFTFVEVRMPAFHRTMDRISAETSRIVSITGHDNGTEIEVFYHFIIKGHLWCAKFRIPRNNPSMPTAVGYFPAASLYERETHEMLGIDFKGNRNLDNILLDKELSPKKPLRKVSSKGGLRPGYPLKKEEVVKNEKTRK